MNPSCPECGAYLHGVVRLDPVPTKPGVSEKPTAPHQHVWTLRWPMFEICAICGVPRPEATATPSDDPRDRHGHRIPPCDDCGKLPCVCPPDCTGPDCGYGLLSLAKLTRDENLVSVVPTGTPSIVLVPTEVK